METQAAVSWSNEAKASEGARRAMRSVIEQLSGDPDFIIAFWAEDVPAQDVLTGITQETEAAQILGSPAAGLIVNSEIRQAGIVIMGIRQPGLRVRLAAMETVPPDARANRECGERLAEELIDEVYEALASGDRHLAMLAIPPSVTRGYTEAIRGMTDLLGPLCPIVGGGAPYDVRVLGRQVLVNRAVAALLSSPNPIGVGVAHGWEPMSRPLVITRAEDNVLMELNGQPAFATYRELFPDVDWAATDFATFARDHPFGLPSVGGEYVVIDPYAVDDAGAIHCAGRLPESGVVNVMHGNPQALREAARRAACRSRDALGGALPRAAVVFDCISRLQFMGDQAMGEIADIQASLGGDVPMIGMFSHGEIAPNRQPGLTVLHNKTAVTLTFA